MLRESGKIVLPYEHFANAVMLKHMTGPHGLHLSVEATVRAVCESYSIGRENFGMEKEFIVEVVQSCPHPACRYYKTHLGSSSGYMDAAFSAQSNVDFLQHLPSQALLQQSAQQSSTVNTPGSIIDLTQLQQTQQSQHSSASAQLQQQRSQIAAAAAAAAAAEKHMKMTPNPQHQLTAAIIQQQNRAIAQQNLEKFNNMTSIEKQRVLQQLDKKQYETALLHAENRSHDRSHDRPISQSHLSSKSPQMGSPLDLQQTQQQSQQVQSQSQQSHKINDYSMKTSNLEIESSNKELLALHNGAWGAYQQQTQNLSTRDNQSLPVSGQQQHHSQLQQQSNQQSQLNTDSRPVPYRVDQLSCDAFSQQLQQQTAQQQSQSQAQSQVSQNQSQQQYLPPSQPVSQENIVRVFDELMKNMARMKTFIRPSMCKPYGKQSESLQKSKSNEIRSY